MPPSTPAPPVIRWSPRRSRGSGGCIVIRTTSSRNTEAGGVGMDKDEEFEERAAAAAEVAARLRSRGIAVTGAENSEALVDLLSAVERFEAAVEAHGGDLMVDDLKSSRPDDRPFVVTRRAQGEGLPAYIPRIVEAASKLGRHPR